MKFIFVTLLKVYRLTISPLLGSNKCRFHPVCSEYGIEAFKEYGSFKAMILILKRILKCHPLHKGGYDPVPIKEKKKN